MGQAGDTAAGAAAGAGAGALAGSIVPGIGTAAGAIGGGLIGGITGYFSSSGGRKGGRAQQVNQDSGYHQYDGNDLGWDGDYTSGAQRRAQEYDALGAKYANQAPTTIDYGQANADYQQQVALGQQYQDVLSGKAPSLAEMQMRRGQDEANQASMNMAASARGGGALLAQQQAGNAQVLSNARVTQDAAMMRVQEQAQARGEYGQMLGQMRGQSAEQAQAQAGTQLQSRQQAYAQGLGYRQEADARREGEREANISIAQGNQSAQTAVQTGAAQAAAAQRAAMYGATAGVVGAGLGAISMSGGGGKKA